MIKKLRRKFVLINMTIVTVLLAAMLGMVFRFNSQALELQDQELMRRLSTQRGRPLAPGEQPDEPMIIFFTLEQSGDSLTVVRDSDHYDLTDQEKLRALVEAAKTAGEETGTLEEYGLRFRVDAGKNGTLYHFADITGGRTIRRNLLQSCLLVGLLSFGAFLVVSILLARWAVRPVEQAWEHQRQFVADASHELKTPLSVIMANAELLQSGDGDDASRARFSGNILAVSYQMRSLVERMLEMARVDSVQLTRKCLDFSQLVQDAVLSVQLLYEERGRSLAAQLQEDIWIRGSESHLYQLLDVLLDNALKYSQGQGAVEVALKAQGTHCLLTVTSPGTPLTAKERREIFKRFYRLDQARSMDGSYGLGLSIAQGIADAHRGRIWATAGEDSNSFHVLLPLCQKPGN